MYELGPVIFHKLFWQHHQASTPIAWYGPGAVGREAYNSRCGILVQGDQLSTNRRQPHSTAFGAFDSKSSQINVFQVIARYNVSERCRGQPHRPCNKADRDFLARYGRFYPVLDCLFRSRLLRTSDLFRRSVMSNQGHPGILPQSPVCSHSRSGH